MRVESALHLSGRAACLVGWLTLVPLFAGWTGVLPEAGEPSARRQLALGLACCLSVGWGLRLACTPVPGVLGVRERRGTIACGVLCAGMLAALPWLLARGMPVA